MKENEFSCLPDEVLVSDGAKQSILRMMLAVLLSRRRDFSSRRMPILHMKQTAIKTHDTIQQ